MLLSTAREGALSSEIARVHDRLAAGRHYVHHLFDHSPRSLGYCQYLVIDVGQSLSNRFGSQGIVATAIPGITDEFHQLDDAGWYGSACFLLVGTSSAMWGKLYKYFSAKLVYLASVALFLIGSIVAATAPNSPALIVARALQGWGCSGSLGGSVLMISYVAEPKKLPMLIGLWMGVFMCSTIIGPLIGGAFTSGITWRWCFWINLPVGGPVVALVLLFFRVPKHIKPAQPRGKRFSCSLISRASACCSLRSFASPWP